MPDTIQGQTPLPIQEYTIVRGTTVGKRDKDGNFAGLRVQETIYIASGSDAEEALDKILTTIGEQDPRLNDISIGDDEYEPELACAIDDIKGQFHVYDRATPDDGSAPSALIIEGETGDPAHYEFVDYNMDDLLRALTTDPVPHE